MSPDIEWHVGEDAEQETIARTSSARRSQRGRWAVIITIGLGVGLGLLYRSIPEPPPQPIDPAPAPAVIESPLSPLPAPAPLDVAIERDAEHLASMNTKNGITFNPALARMPQAYADWYAALQNAYGRWGPPAYQTLYTVFETGTLPSGVVWVKLGNFATAISIVTPVSIAWRMIAGSGHCPINLSGAVRPPRYRRAMPGRSDR